MNIYLDIETIPSQDPQYLAALRDRIKAEADAEIAALKPPGNIKDPVKIEMWHQTERAAKEDLIRSESELKIDQQYRATSFDGAHGHVAVIGFAIDDADPITLCVDHKNLHGEQGERGAIAKFFHMIDKASTGQHQRPTFIGHNLVGFDLRFLFQRAVVLGVRPPASIPFHAKPWDERVFDTMTKWAGDRNRVSMASLCDALGLAGKGAELGEEIDGSMVWDFIQAGRISDVAIYCAGDVIRTREIHKRLTFAFYYQQAEERIFVGDSELTTA